jgi:ribosomal protein S18 acetylase RimI-like enzyme
LTVGGGRGLAARVTLRPRTDADEPFLARVFASTRPRELALLGSSPERQAAFARSQSSIQHRAYVARYPDASFDLVILDGDPAGRLYVHRGEDDIRVIDIALLPEFRGAGIGTHLLGELLAEATARGSRVSLHVDVGSRAEALYRRRGFVPVAATEVAVLMEWSPPAGADQANTAS